MPTALLTPTDLTDPAYLFASPSCEDWPCEWCGQAVGLVTWHVMVDPDNDECCDVCQACVSNAGFPAWRVDRMFLAIVQD